MWALRRRIILSWRSVRPRARYRETFKGEMMTGMLKKALFVMLPISLAAGDAKAQSSYDLRSPNNRIELRIRTANGIRYDVLLGGRAILQDCTLSIDVDHKRLGAEAKVLKHKEGSQDRVIHIDGKRDRKSTRLNSSHANISYADFCLEKKRQIPARQCGDQRRAVRHDTRARFRAGPLAR